jgi:ABC-type Fe3+ transport system permease subunit
MFSYLVIFIIVALGMQIYSNRKNALVYSQTRGVIKSRQDLQMVKNAISLSMKLAVIYILLFVLFILLMGLSAARGGSLGRAALCLFIFGVVTLPIGLIGKSYEKKIKTLRVEGDDPQVAEKFQQYLKQWNEARFGLSD